MGRLFSVKVLKRSKSMKGRDYLLSKYKVYKRCQEVKFTDISKRTVTYLPIQDANMEKKPIRFSAMGGWKR